MLNKTQSIGPYLIAVPSFFMVLWWVTIFFRGIENTTENFLFGTLLGIIPILGSLIGFLNFKKWGGFQSAVGVSLFFLCLGYLMWGIGTLIFAFFNLVLKVEVPYPSTADALYILSWPLWAIGIISLAKVTGAKFQLKTLGGKIFLFLIPCIAAIISYFLLVVVARDGVLLSGNPTENMIRTFFDLAYPIGTLIIVSLVMLVHILSIRFLGGIFKLPITLLLLGFVFNYFADFSFAYTTSTETFFVANWVDLLFLVAFSIMSLSISLLNPDRIKNDMIETDVS